MKTKRRKKYNKKSYNKKTFNKKNFRKKSYNKKTLGKKNFRKKSYKKFKKEGGTGKENSSRAASPRASALPASRRASALPASSRALGLPVSSLSRQEINIKEKIDDQLNRGFVIARSHLPKGKTSSSARNTEKATDGDSTLFDRRYSSSIKDHRERSLLKYMNLDRMGRMRQEILNHNPNISYDDLEKQIKSKLQDEWLKLGEEEQAKMYEISSLVPRFGKVLKNIREHIVQENEELRSLKEKVTNLEKLYNQTMTMLANSRRQTEEEKKITKKLKSKFNETKSDITKLIEHLQENSRTILYPGL